MSGFLFGKDGEAGDIKHIVDAAGRRPETKQAARSQIEFSDTAYDHRWFLRCQRRYEKLSYDGIRYESDNLLKLPLVSI